MMNNGVNIKFAFATGMNYKWTVFILRFDGQDIISIKLDIVEEVYL